MDSFILEQQLCDYIEGMDVIPELWEPNSLDSPMGERLITSEDFAADDGDRWHSNALNFSLSVGPVDEDLRSSDCAMVILRDRLITDAALCDSREDGRFSLAPISTEHSYSLAEQSIDVNTPVTTSAGQKSCGAIETTCRGIKKEPQSVPSSPGRSCTSGDEFLNLNFPAKSTSQQTTAKTADRDSITRQSNVPSRLLLPRLSIQLESNVFNLPPTPPSSTSSDSEGSLSPTREVSSPRGATPTGGRVLLQRTGLGHASSNRQPINSPLISYQPKGSIGVLNLTEEEKRTLLAEGYSVPTKLPLTKAEEKSLKKIRRKIKNKISAQESRRKKKEYMDTLERQASELVDENAEFRMRVSRLEADNAALLKELKRLQQLVTQAGLQVQPSQFDKVPMEEVVIKCEEDMD